MAERILWLVKGNFIIEEIIRIKIIAKKSFEDSVEISKLFCFKYPSTIMAKKKAQIFMIKI